MRLFCGRSQEVYVLISVNLVSSRSWRYVCGFLQLSAVERPRLDPHECESGIMSGVTAMSFCLEKLQPSCWRYTMLQQCSGVNWRSDAYFQTVMFVTVSQQYKYTIWHKNFQTSVIKLSRRSN